MKAKWEDEKNAIRAEKDQSGDRPVNGEVDSP